MTHPSEESPQLFYRYDYQHAWTDEASIVTVSRQSRGLGTLPVCSSVLCPSHTRKASANAGDECSRSVQRVEGRHVCARCVEFTSVDHSKLVAILRKPGTYVRRRGFQGAIGIVYDYDPSSPSGAHSSGVSFDPYCPFAAATAKALASRTEPTRP